TKTSVIAVDHCLVPRLVVGIVYIGLQLETLKSTAPLQLALQPLINHRSNIGGRPNGPLRQPDNPVLDIHPIIGKASAETCFARKLLLMIQTQFPAGTFFWLKV